MGVYTDLQITTASILLVVGVAFLIYVMYGLFKLSPYGKGLGEARDRFMAQEAYTQSEEGVLNADRQIMDAIHQIDRKLKEMDARSQPGRAPTRHRQSLEATKANLQTVQDRMFRDFENAKYGDGRTPPHIDTTSLYTPTGQKYDTKTHKNFGPDYTASSEYGTAYPGETFMDYQDRLKSKRVKTYLSNHKLPNLYTPEMTMEQAARAVKDRYLDDLVHNLTHDPMEVEERNKQRKRNRERFDNQRKSHVHARDKRHKARKFLRDTMSP